MAIGTYFCVWFQKGWINFSKWRTLTCVDHRDLQVSPTVFLFPTKPGLPLRPASCNIPKIWLCGWAQVVAEWNCSNSAKALKPKGHELMKLNRNTPSCGQLRAVLTVESLSKFWLCTSQNVTTFHKMPPCCGIDHKSDWFGAIKWGFHCFHLENIKGYKIIISLCLFDTWKSSRKNTWFISLIAFSHPLFLFPLIKMSEVLHIIFNNADYPLPNPVTFISIHPWLLIQFSNIPCSLLREAGLAFQPKILSQPFPASCPPGILQYNKWRVLSNLVWVHSSHFSELHVIGCLPPPPPPPRV